MVQQLTSSIFSIPVPLPGNPLKNLNSYVIKTPGRNLLIDTGFRMPECLEALQSGIGELSLDMEKTDIFITHLHSDHSGLAADILHPGSKIYMGGDDVDLLRWSLFKHDEYIDLVTSRYILMGYTEDMLAQSLSDNPAFHSALNRDLPFTKVYDGTVITLGDHRLKCIHTPGHTPGHTCLYLENEKILFSGDHILFDITPNITAWAVLDDTLGSYLDSLKKIKSYDIQRTLAGHRKNGPDTYERIDQLLSHHQARLDELLRIIRDNPGISSCDAASHMTWSIRAKDWQSFPPTQKWFAVGEAASHLIHLEKLGLIRCDTREGMYAYTVTGKD